jgi:hypothetical protein
MNELQTEINISLHSRATPETKKPRNLLATLIMEDDESTRIKWLSEIVTKPLADLCGYHELKDPEDHDTSLKTSNRNGQRKFLQVFGHALAADWIAIFVFQTIFRLIFIVSNDELFASVCCSFKATPRIGA